METIFSNDLINSINRLRSYYPYRIIIVAVKEGENAIIEACKTKAKGNNLARKGWTVYVVK